MALRIDSRGIAGGSAVRGLVGHGRALAQCADSRGMAGPRSARESAGHGRALALHADLRDVALRTLLLRALALWDNGRGRAAGLRKAANFDGGFGRAVRSIWRDV